jgi:hypothetical protein
MKKGNLEMGVLIAVAAVAAIGAIFMFSGDELTGLTSYSEDPQFSQQQSDCLMGCYQALQTESRNNDHLSRQKLENCLNYCQSLPKTN